MQGDGWYKDEDGYHYTKPEGKLDNPEEPLVEEVIVVTDEPIQEIVTEVVEEYVPPNEYLPPDNDLREYLPPKSEEAKRKRQIAARKAQTHRRFVRRH